MNCGEAIEVLKKFPKDKPLMIMGWYSIIETDAPAIVSDKYHEIASEFP